VTGRVHQKDQHQHYRWITDTPRISRVRCRTCVVSNTDTYNYTKLCDFLKLLSVWCIGVRVMFGVRVHVFHSYL